MPTMLIEPVEPVVQAPTGPRRKTWTREEVAALAESGALNVERLELVEGELLDKMGKNRSHVLVQHQIAMILAEVFGIARVTIESTLEVANIDRRSNEPVPDLVVTHREARFYRNTPLPEEASHVVEVSDTSLRYDLTTKAALYARAAVIEYWVADLNNRTLIVHRQPENGRYASVTVYSADESVSPLAAPTSSVAVSSLFP